MAKKTVVTLVDDLDGSDATETVSFAFDGATYEIDLSAENAAALRAALKPYVDVARRTSRAPARRSTGTSTDAKVIRAWAEERGIAVPSRGRIPAEVQEQYRAANA